MKAVYAFRDDADFMLKFMGIVPANYSTVEEWVEKLDDEEAWPESHYALYIDLDTFEVSVLDDGQVCSLTEVLEDALASFYGREAE